MVAALPGAGNIWADCRPVWSGPCWVAGASVPRSLLQSSRFPGLAWSSSGDYIKYNSVGLSDTQFLRSIPEDRYSLNTSTAAGYQSSFHPPVETSTQGSSAGQGILHVSCLLAAGRIPRSGVGRRPFLVSWCTSRPIRACGANHCPNAVQSPRRRLWGGEVPCLPHPSSWWQARWSLHVGAVLLRGQPLSIPPLVDGWPCCSSVCALPDARGHGEQQA